jgi:drug/metabolite transporter (DMT)-like permease
VTGDSTLAGFIVALGAAACFDTAYAIQALEARSVDKRYALRASLITQLLRRPRWVAGMVLIAAGYGLQIAALSLASLTLVQPVLALGLLLLLYLGWRVLGEQVGWREIGGVVAVLCGITAVALAAPARSENAGLGWDTALAMGVLGAAVVAPFALRARGVLAPWLLVFAAGAGDAFGAFGTKLVADELGEGRVLLAVVLGVVAVSGGALALTSEMTALQKLPATRVAPVVLVMQIVIPVLLAPLLVGEKWGATAGGGSVLVAGLVAVAGGTVLLGSSPAVGDLVAASEAGPGSEAVEHHGSG